MFPRILYVSIFWCEVLCLCTSCGGPCLFLKAALHVFKHCIGISPVSLLTTHVSCFLSVASPKNCLFICFCFVGYCFCMRCLAAVLLCHFSFFGMLSFLLAAVLRVSKHNSSCSRQLLLSFCLGGSGKLLRCFPGSLLTFVFIRSRRSSHTSLPASLVSLCCMATLWRLFLGLLSPSSLRFVHLVLSLNPLTGPPLKNLHILWAMGKTCCSMSCSREL